MYTSFQNGNDIVFNRKKFICDTMQDLNEIKTELLAAGSGAIVLDAGGGKQQRYILSNGKKWVQYNLPETSGTGGGGSSVDVASVDETLEFLGF